MGYQSEAQLEKNLLTQLTQIGYSSVAIPDYETLLSNFHTQLSIFNEHKLNNQPITDVEFKRILTLIEGKSIYDSAKILRDKLLIERTSIILWKSEERELLKSNFIPDNIMQHE